MSVPILAFTDYTKDFLLKTDASKEGLGGLRHFKEYLLYWPFLVGTDNNPLTYIMTTPNLDATGHQWVGVLAKFNFQLAYQKGRDSTMADVLS